MVRRADISAVIFDMDGLVLDTEKTYQAAWRTAGRAMRYDFPDVFLEGLAGLAGDAVLRGIANFCGPGFDPGEFNRLTTACWRDYVAVHGIEVKTGFHALRDYLNREAIPFCLATNSALVNAEACLALAGLADVFPVVVARDHVRRPKPSPDVFLQAASVLKVPVGRCLVLEDSPAGIEAAFEAAAVPVMVPSMRPVDAATLARCRFVLNDLGELPGMLG
ncbi:HAD family hydrolase [Candidatus Methylomicrobium oryzae]|uniref:HAD family hydrolase n=1 Tax=Candidatus Methylomicrobium oryzae TaxID=2802053 RepID=UPI0019224B63|nr:HAD family phosphatase [Methylomicrobium sp. RS1]MBL1263185.1 HAD family phosphatase [Methylomicrobium sp. RS1]